ncbi:bZIP transcription factor 12-like isoform X2 [Rhododendron vialii]|uniref:bZIP transcription factor 12-like isoform X2 n=1 Tax=Rhododendron vialii TaxID=182163 RepID=UPI00265E0330|nr:bZIP transcription factor 12-like isoform X2 [Rhododendron vialii]
MASSKVMMASSTSPSNPDLPRQHPSSSSIHSLSLAEGSMNMDDILRNIYADDDAQTPFPDEPPSSAAVQNGGVSSKTVDEVWKEIVAGGGGTSREQQPEMTLEDFLTKAGAVTEDDVRITASQFQAQPVGYGVDSAGFRNGIEGAMVAVGGGGGGRGKRRAVEEPPVDRATQQKQRRMIKNRESAARSRERKQAYTVELESLVTQLEEENSRLLREEAEQSKERFKQLMDNLIPVVEQRRPPRSLRRINSMCW